MNCFKFRKMSNTRLHTIGLQSTKMNVMGFSSSDGTVFIYTVNYYTYLGWGNESKLNFPFI